MTITLEGLTHQQYQIADLLWNCESQEHVQTLINSMPADYKKDAVVIHQLMIAAVMDQHTEITEDVKDCISRICS
jgi:hypothetical protein